MRSPRDRPPPALRLVHGRRHDDDRPTGINWWGVASLAILTASGAVSLTIIGALVRCSAL